MNSEKSQGTEPFKVLIIGGGSRGTLRMIERLREQYGDRLEVIERPVDNPCGEMSFIIMDEFSELPKVCPEIKMKGGRSGIRPYWQKGRW